MTSRVRIIGVLCAAIAATSAVPAAAGAVVLAPATGCPQEEQPATPFETWGDRAGYVSVPDGHFGDGASEWTLRRATVEEDNAPWSGGHRALEVRGSARSPEFCIGIEHPTFRFFARNAGSPLSALLVDIVLTTPLGLQFDAPVGLVTSFRDDWAPTSRMLVLGNLLMLAPGEKTRVSLRFTALGLNARWRIDDVYVDPYAKI